MVNFLRNHGARTKIVNYAVAIIVAIALSQDNAIFRGRVRWFSPVEGFQTKSTRTRSRVIPSVTENAGSRDANTVPSSLALTSTSNTILFMAQGNNKMKNSKKNDDETTASPVFWKDLQKKPGNLIMLPFVALFGFDLVINIFFLSKRAIEFFVFGTIPSSEPWW
eukprot:jgi/Psemu1/205124/e_gw1.366.6.1